jgi:hypothetical protein
MEDEHARLISVVQPQGYGQLREQMTAFRWQMSTIEGQKGGRVETDSFWRPLPRGATAKVGGGTNPLRGSGA